MNKKERVLELMKNVEYPMLVTQADGLMARPMKTIDVDIDGKISFFTTFQSNKVGSVIQNRDVLVIFNDSKEKSYVSAQGVANISFDKEKMKEHWSLIDKAFFTEGFDTHGLCMIEVDLTHVEAWDSNKNIFEIAFDVVFSLRDGKKASIGDQISTNFN